MKGIKFLGGEKTKAFFTSEDGHTKPQQVLSVAAMLGAVTAAELVITEPAYACGEVKFKGNECIDGSRPCGDGAIFDIYIVPDLDGDGEEAGFGDWALYPGSDAEADHEARCESLCGDGLDTHCDNPLGAEVFCCA